MNTTTTPTNIMIDIETLGLAPGSVITSLGAVKFGDSKIIDRFYRRIDLQSCIDAGLTIDPDTLVWWLDQSDEARKQITLPGEKLQAVLDAFTIWVGIDAEIWGNGAAYDNVLLACAYKATNCCYPLWAHKRSLCYRTLKNSYKFIPIDSFRVGNHHNAVDDAESQALHLMAIQEYEDRLAGMAGQLGSAVALAKRIYFTAHEYFSVARNAGLSIRENPSQLEVDATELEFLEKVVNTPLIVLKS